MAALPVDWTSKNFWQRNAYRDAQSSSPGDCGPATVGCALDIASMADYDVGTRPYGGNVFSTNKRDAQNKRRSDVMALIRSKAHAPAFGATSQAQMHTAFEAFGTEFAAINRQPPSARKLYPGNWTTDLKPDLVAGRFASLGIWRQPLKDSGLMGGELFVGKHAILVGFYDNGVIVPGVETVLCFDPLLDGRYPGYKQGPIRIPLSVVKSASDLYTPGSNAASPNVVYGWTFTPRGHLGTGVTITAISAANPTHVTTATAHGLSTGDWILISGSNSTPALTGPYQVTVLDDTHFTVAVNVTGAGTAGTWTDSDDTGVGTGEVPFIPCQDEPL